MVVAGAAPAYHRAYDAVLDACRGGRCAPVSMCQVWQALFGDSRRAFASGGGAAVRRWRTRASYAIDVAMVVLFLASLVFILVCGAALVRR